LARFDFAWFKQRAEYGPFFIRVALAWFLIWNSQDNVFSWARMLEFRDFLGERGVPFPLVGAVVSVYCQLVAGISWLAGAFTRWTAALMVVNFIAALLIAHRGTPAGANFPATAMLGGALFLLFHGPGLLSVDAWREGRGAIQRSVRR
jgi:putative oxidoreductase